MLKSRLKKIDAILIHAYWYDIKKSNSLDLANKIQVFAIENICKKFEVANIVITAGKISKVHPAIGYELKRQIKMELPTKFHEKIHVYPTQKTTIGEIKQFKRTIATNNWKQMAVLGVSLHMPRIKRDFAKVFKNVEHNTLFFEAEKNLSQKDFPTLKKYINSKEHTLLKLNEQIEKSIENIPIIGNILLETVSKFLVNKGYFQPKIVNFFYKISNIKTQI